VNADTGSDDGFATVAENVKRIHFTYALSWIAQFLSHDALRGT